MDQSLYKRIAGEESRTNSGSRFSSSRCKEQRSTVNRRYIHESWGGGEGKDALMFLRSLKNRRYLHCVEERPGIASFSTFYKTRLCSGEDVPPFFTGTYLYLRRFLGGGQYLASSRGGSVLLRRRCSGVRQ